MPAKHKPQRRSSCPVNASLEILGDRWSLLIIRDLMLRSYRAYKEFLSSDEGIATNILADAEQAGDRMNALRALGVLGFVELSRGGWLDAYGYLARSLEALTATTNHKEHEAGTENTESRGSFLCVLCARSPCSLWFGRFSPTSPRAPAR